MNKLIQHIILFGVFCVTSMGYCQENVDSTQYFITAKYEAGTPPVELKKSVVNSKHAVLSNVRTHIQKLHDYGFLSASLDSISYDSAQATAHIFVGKKFTLTHLNTDSVDQEILAHTGFRDKQFRNKPLKPKDISAFFKSTITYLENNGYPFATIQLAHVNYSQNEINASVILKKNQFYSIDSIQILGEDVRLSQTYIENAIRIHTGQPYSEQLIKNISARIRENPFMDELKSFEVRFQKNSCTLILILKPKKSSYFDGIIGAQPQPNSDEIIFTGDIKIGLGNIVGQGEQLSFRWQKMQTQTQELNAKIEIPFLFKTPIGFAYEIDIYRRDTTFNNVNQQIELPFTFWNGSKFKGYFQRFKSTLLATDAYKNSSTIPPYNDVENISYGIGYSIQNTDNSRNPFRGWTLQINTGFGRNKILPITALENVSYDSIQLEANSLNLNGAIQLFTPIAAQNTLLFQVKGASIQSDNLIENQLYRIGGMGSIRGMDQQSINASSYSIFTFEYRLLFGETSRIHAFFDLAWYERTDLNSYRTDTPYGFGAGITFGTNAGIFTLDYALGSEFGNPITFRTGKIHFGFINVF